MTMPNQRTLNIFININIVRSSKGVLTALRRLTIQEDYLTILDCGRVPINNLDPVIRVGQFNKHLPILYIILYNKKKLN